MTKSLLPETSRLIQKTLLIANLMDGFWDRWKSHGVEDHAIGEVRSHLSTLQQWVHVWEKHAECNENMARLLLRKRSMEQAEYSERLAALYYHLLQWIYPVNNEAKAGWLEKSIAASLRADAAAAVETRYDSITIDGLSCYGRIRIPEAPVGCIVMINPLDSGKEEMFTYEMEFVKWNFATLCFDGPGQGETYAFQGLRGSRERWSTFIDKLIDCAAVVFPGLPIHLFGTSSGAAWALYGSASAKVTKVVAVSPALTISVPLPDYFVGRMKAVIEPDESILPKLDQVQFRSPVLLFHGAKDLMVDTQEIHSLYHRLPKGKRYQEYADEGHCCNYKLSEIRKLALVWLLNKEEM